MITYTCTMWPLNMLLMLFKYCILYFGVAVSWEMYSWRSAQYYSHLGPYLSLVPARWFIYVGKHPLYFFSCSRSLQWNPARMIGKIIAGARATLMYKQRSRFPGSNCACPNSAARLCDLVVTCCRQIRISQLLLTVHRFYPHSKNALLSRL